MSDRDESVSQLVEDLFVASRQKEIWRESMADLIIAFLAEQEAEACDREASLQASVSTGLASQRLEEENAALQAQLHRALGEGAGLREAMDDLASRLDGFSDEITDRVQREGFDLSPAVLQRWEGVSEGYLKSARKIRAALASSPLSERAGALLAAVADVVHADGKEALDAALARLVDTHGALSLALEPDADE